jgi:hypothetical protein
VDGGPLITPVDELDILLAEHYGQRAERYRATAQGYVDDKLHEIFPVCKGRKTEAVIVLLQKNRHEILNRVIRWSQLEEDEVGAILDKLEVRAETLGLQFNLRDQHARLMDLTALATSLAMNFSYTGRLTG